MLKILLTVKILLLLVSCSSSKTFTVPTQFKSIQAAVDAAAYGDTVIVEPGIYLERIKMKAGVILKSMGDDSKGKLGLLRAEKTVIDGSRSPKDMPGVEMAVDAVIDGFTVTGVGKYDEVRWKKHYKSKGEMQSHDHIGEPGTAGIATQVDCKIENNIIHHIGYTGIALSGEKCTATVRSNICYRNMGGGIGSMSKSKALIEKNICYENFLSLIHI